MSSQIGTHYGGGGIIQRDKRGELAGFKSSFDYTLLAKLIIFRLVQDRDIKIIITGKGKTTGTGKTTVAIIIARWVNMVRNDIFDMDKEWSAKDYAFMSVWEYLKQYRDADPGDPLISDELEYMFDRRRSTTHENTKGTQAWSILRYKNVVTIGTAPGIVDLDKRIPEGADVWINVQKKGEANVYYLTFNDFEMHPIHKRLEIGNFKERILWNEIEKDEDYQFLKQTKKEIGVPGVDDMGNEIGKEDLNDAKVEMKKKVVVELLKMKEEGVIDLTQAQIGEIVDYSQESVARTKRLEMG